MNTKHFLIAISFILFATTCKEEQQEPNWLSHIIQENSSNLDGWSTLPSALPPSNTAETDETANTPAIIDAPAASNEVLIFAREDITTEETTILEADIAALGGTILEFSVEMRMWRIQTSDVAEEAEFLEQISSNPSVSGSGLNLILNFTEDNQSGYANYLKRLKGYALPELHKSWSRAVSYPGFAGDYWIAHTKADEAWEITTGSDADGAVIGIVDSGLEKDSLVLDETRIERYNKNGAPLSDDDTKTLTDHGKNVTALLAGFNDDPTVRGMAWQNRIVSVDVGSVASCDGDECLDGILLTDAIKGVKTAIQKGATVINISLGFNDCDVPSETRLQKRRMLRESFTASVNFAKRKDRLLVFSASNGCEKQDNLLLPEGSLTNSDAWDTHALIVTATNSDKQYGSNADTGAVIDLAAPGDATGWGQTTVSGASFAAPLITGAAALLESINSSLAAPEVRYLLASSAEPVVTADSATDTESNLLLLNAKSAVNAASLSVGVVLEESDKVNLVKGRTKELDYTVTLPATTVSAVDMLLLVDVSGSYGDDIFSLQLQANDIMTDLDSRGLDIQFGVSSFSDFPLSPYGYSGDQAFYLNQSITDYGTAVIDAINTLTLDIGGDLREAQCEALYQAATGLGRDLNGDGLFDAPGELEPVSVGWRTGAMRMILLSTDANFHDSDSESGYPGHPCDATIATLQEEGIQVMGLASGGALPDLTALTDATGGVTYPLSSDSSEIATAIADSLDTSLSMVNLSIQRVSGSEWIESITPESYENVLPGESRTFRITLVGRKDKPIKALDYNVYLWALVNNSGLVGRLNIPVLVPAADGGG